MVGESTQPDSTSTIMLFWYAESLSISVSSRGFMTPKMPGKPESREWSMVQGRQETKKPWSSSPVLWRRRSLRLKTTFETQSLLSPTTMMCFSSRSWEQMTMSCSKSKHWKRDVPKNSSNWLAMATDWVNLVVRKVLDVCIAQSLSSLNPLTIDALLPSLCMKISVKSVYVWHLNKI